MSDKKVTFFGKMGGIFAEARDIEGFSHLWKERRWDFAIGDKIFQKDDWRGREEAEKLFGRCVILKPQRW